MLFPIAATRCSSLYQSLLLQKVVGLLSFFAILVLQLLQPEDINTNEQRASHLVFPSTTLRVRDEIYCLSGKSVGSLFPQKYLCSISCFMSMPCFSSSSLWAKAQSTGSAGVSAHGVLSLSALACTGWLNRKTWLFPRMMRFPVRVLSHQGKCIHVKCSTLLLCRRKGDIQGERELTDLI